MARISGRGQISDISTTNTRNERKFPYWEESLIHVERAAQAFEEVIVLGTLLGVSMMAMTAMPAPPAEDKVVETCEDWWRRMDVNGPAAAASVPGNGL